MNSIIAHYLRLTSTVSTLLLALQFTQSAPAQSAATATLKITKPGEGSVFVAPARIAIEVVAVDPDGDIRRVEFFANGQLIGVSEHLTRDAVIPGRPREHFLEWGEVSTGSYTLRTKAIATNGNGVESEPVKISVVPGNGLAKLVQAGAIWKYRHNGTNPGAEWKNLDFADSEWPSGPAQLGYGDGDEATVLAEGAASPHPVTAYFRHKFEVPVPAAFSPLVLRLVRDDGAVVYINGQEVLRDNLPDGPITPETLASGAASPEEENAFRTFEIPTASLKTGVNIIAVEVHQVNVASSDLSFDLELAALIDSSLATLKITSPREDETFREGLPITIDAVAIDPKSYMPRVEFFANDAKIGVSQINFIVAPDPGTPIYHSFEWNNAPVGEHLLTARAVDAAGNAVVSPPVQIKVLRAGETPIIRISAIDSEATELPPQLNAINLARFQISREGGDMSRGTLVFYSVHGTARNGGDYQELNGTIEIPGGQTSATLEIIPLADVLTVVERMETAAIRLEPSPMVGPMPTYDIDPLYREAAAVIYEGQPPQDGQLELAFPGSGETFYSWENIPLIAAGYHPTIDVSEVDFYAGNVKIGSSHVDPEKVQEGGLIFHRFEWKTPPAGMHTLTAQATLPNGIALVSSQIKITVVGTDEKPVVSIRFIPHETDEPWPDADFAPGSLEVRRTGPMDKPLLVFYIVSGTATPEADYTRLPGNILIPEGQPATRIRVQAKDDLIHEGEETVLVTLINTPLNVDPAQPADYRIDPEHAFDSIIILDNDPPIGEATLEITAPKDGAVFPFGASITIDATAIDPKGYISRVEFYDRDTRIGVSEIVFIQPPNPGTPVHHSLIWRDAEPGEHVLTARAVDTLGNRTVSPPVHVTVAADERQLVVAVEAADAIATEPSDNNTLDSAVFVIKRIAGPDVAVHAYYRVEGTAQNGVDYSELSGSVLLPAGAAAAEVVVKPIADKALEREESVVLILEFVYCAAIFPRPPGCYLIGLPGSARAVIRDNSSTGNHPPVVEILRPKNGAVFTLGETIEIRVEASDSDGTVQKLELFAGDQLLGSSNNGELTATWTPTRAGEYALRSRASDVEGAIGSHSIRVLVREVNAAAFVHRELPGAYAPGRPFPVRLRATPPPGSSAYGVEDQPPKGWQVSEISHDGVFDAATGKVKFGPFTDGETRVLAYHVTPPINAVGRYEFTGLSSVNGKTYPVGGHRFIEGVSSKHPADQNQDSSITLVEVTSYAAAWKDGATWPFGPVPIPLSYVTRSAYLWKHGEAYGFDPSQGAPPLCWVPATGQPRITALLVQSGDWKRSSPPTTVPGAALEFQVSVTPPAGVASYALEEKIPAGWTVLSISHDGNFDPESGCIRWGLFLDAGPRVITYSVQPPAEVATIGGLDGTISFDGSLERIGGNDRVIAADATTSLRVEDCDPQADGSVRVKISGATGQLCVVEASSDLVKWVELVTTYLPDGQIEYHDETAATENQRYYRVRVR